MRRFLVMGAVAMVFLCLIGCSRETPEKIRYDMEKMVFATGKLAERLAEPGSGGEHAAN